MFSEEFEALAHSNLETVLANPLISPNVRNRIDDVRSMLEQIHCDPRNYGVYVHDIENELNASAQYLRSNRKMRKEAELVTDILLAYFAERLKLLCSFYGRSIERPIG